MKRILLQSATLMFPMVLLAQTVIEKSIDIAADQTIAMSFKHPELIQVTPWDQQKVKIIAEVSINHGNNDESFELEINEEDMTIRSIIRDYEKLPRKVVVKYAGNEYYFNTTDVHAPEVQKFLDEIGGKGYDYIKTGVVKKITLKINVPNNIKLAIDSKYGMIEVFGFLGDIQANSKFAGVDVSVDDQLSSQLEIRSKFGELYSNLDVDFKSIGEDRIGRWITFSGQLKNSQKKVEIESEFGNIYLRKL